MKIITFLSFFFLATLAFGQNYLPENLAPVQAGTANLTNGLATIILDSNTTAYLSSNKESAYFVEITPIGNCGLLKIDKKGNTSFTITIADNGANNGSFDYVVFLKYSLIPLNQNRQALQVGPAMQTTPLIK
jgi:hypothetical protein